MYCSLTKQHRAGTTSKMCHFYEVVFQGSWIFTSSTLCFWSDLFSKHQRSTEGSIRARQGNKLTVLADGVLRKAKCFIKGHQSDCCTSVHISDKSPFPFCSLENTSIHPIKDKKFAVTIKEKYIFAFISRQSAVLRLTVTFEICLCQLQSCLHGFEKQHTVALGGGEKWLEREGDGGRGNRQWGHHWTVSELSEEPGAMRCEAVESTQMPKHILTF